MHEVERRILAAAMERILPVGAYPGAREANAVGYAEWLSEHASFQHATRAFADGLVLLERLAIAQRGMSFADCDAAGQDAVLAAVASSARPAEQRFFSMLVKMTLAGVFCRPEYGGNRNGIGWRSIGFRSPTPTGAPGPHVSGC